MRHLQHVWCASLGKGGAHFYEVEFYEEKELPDIAFICKYTRKWFPLQDELAPLTKNVIFSY